MAQCTITQHNNKDKNNLKQKKKKTRMDRENDWKISGKDHVA
jgi:hypothetical protein